MSTPSTASLREHFRVLQLYTEAIGGRRVELRSTEELPEVTSAFRRDLPTSTASCVFLPSEVGGFSNAKDNFTVYKIAILHQLGFWDCGTFDFELAAWSRMHPSGASESWSSAAQEGSSDSDLALFFVAFDRPTLARQIFSILEDTRVDAALARRYRGIRADLERLQNASLALRPDIGVLSTARGLLEALLQLSLGAEPDALEVHQGLGPQLELLHEALTEVRQSGADVYATAAATVRIYGRWQNLGPGEALPVASGAAANAQHSETIDAVMNGADEDTAGASSAPISGEDAGGAEPVPYRGELKPELIQKEIRLGELVSDLEKLREGGAPLPPELLRELLEKGLIEITAVEQADLANTSGLTLSDLPEGVTRAALAEIRADLEERVRGLTSDLEEELGDLSPRQDVHYYDEWDHELNAYRRGWCRLGETPLEEADVGALESARRSQARLFAEVRRQFELLRPDTLRKIKGLTDGEDVDLDAAVEAWSDLRAGLAPSDKLYTRRSRRDRSVAAAFLLDMSASTDSEIPDPEEVQSREPAPKYDYVGVFDDDPFWTRSTGLTPLAKRRRVIDVEKEALLLMSEALEALGDAYAIYGFSGYGRENVDFFVAKDFSESYDRRTLGRMAAIEPKRSTRMGPAIRHAAAKLEKQDARIKVLLILSDGYPQDFDYGRDRTSREYGINDTMMALREAELRGVHTFCITVDPTGHDYLRQMCSEHSYLVIDDIAALPKELPKVYRGLTT